MKFAASFYTLLFYAVLTWCSRGYSEVFFHSSIESSIQRKIASLLEVFESSQVEARGFTTLRTVGQERFGGNWDPLLYVRSKTILMVGENFGQDLGVTPMMPMMQVENIWPYLGGQGWEQFVHYSNLPGGGQSSPDRIGYSFLPWIRVASRYQNILSSYFADHVDFAVRNAFKFQFISTLFHELRHSACSLNTRNGQINCGFFHNICADGYLRGYFGCDSGPWGAYMYEIFSLLRVQELYGASFRFGSFDAIIFDRIYRLPPRIRQQIRIGRMIGGQQVDRIETPNEQAWVNLLTRRAIFDQ